MFARFDENPAMTLRVIKETKRYGRTDARTDGQRENSIPPTNKVCGGYKNGIFEEEKNCFVPAKVLISWLVHSYRYSWVSDPYLFYKSIKDTPVCGQLDFNCLKL